MEVGHKTGLRSLINSAIAGGIAGMFLELSPIEIISISAMFGVFKPLGDKYIFKRQMQKPLIPYYMVGTGIGLTFTQLIKNPPF